jgi:hypothetical protein
MKKISAYFFEALLLSLLISLTTVGANDVNGEWSGTLQLTGQTRAESVYMVLKQDGNNLSGSGGPNESEQHPFQGGKVEGNKLVFDVPLGESSMHFELEVQGAQIRGQMKHQREGSVETAKVALKRLPEK